MDCAHSVTSPGQLNYVVEDCPPQDILRVGRAELTCSGHVAMVVS
jgi:hypothetical protein